MHKADKREITIFIGASSEKPTGQHHQVNFIPPRLSRPNAATDGDLYIQIAIQDSGQGLSEDEMKVLFQRFSQGNSKTYKQYGGSGLGLFISRELSELQGGQIGVSSGKGKTTFTFYVRTKRWTPDENETSAAPTLLPFISNSASPYALHRRGSEVMITDLSATHTPIGELPPPFDSHIAEVESPVSSSVASTTEVNKLIAETEKYASQGMHVLIVEDNVINQKILAKQLSRELAVSNVHLANHGLEALSFLEKSRFCAAETPLSIILLDLEMPEMDGITCIRRIREMQATGLIFGHVPVIAVTANARSEQIALAIDAGMDSVVTKPFRVPELVPQMENLLSDLARRFPV